MPPLVRTCSYLQVSLDCLQAVNSCGSFRCPFTILSRRLQELQELLPLAELELSQELFDPITTKAAVPKHAVIAHVPQCTASKVSQGCVVNAVSCGSDFCPLKELCRQISQLERALQHLSVLAP